MELNNEELIFITTLTGSIFIFLSSLTLMFILMQLKVINKLIMLTATSYFEQHTALQYYENLRYNDLVY